MPYRSLAVFSMIAAACLAVLPAAGQDPVKPNILLIMADDVGYECFGYTGSDSYDTPNIDALAAGGLRFRHAYSTPKCVPSRVTLLTGCYAHRTDYEWGWLPEEEITIAERLQQAGYATAVAGKWQLNLLKDNPEYPHEKGFDEYSLWAWHEGPRYFQPWIWQNGELLKEAIEDQYGPDIYAGFLKDFITENRDRPWFAYYPMNLCHFPKDPEPPGPEGHLSYAEMIAEMDRQVGRLVKTLDALGLRESTLILFTTDNGSPSQVVTKWRGRNIPGGKSDLTDAGTHAPFVANWPGVIEAGRTTKALVDFTDFFPTLASLAGAALPQDVHIDGHNFSPVLHEEPYTPRDWVFTEWKGKAWARDQHWKLYNDGRLFHLTGPFTEDEALDRYRLRPEAQRAYERLDAALRQVWAAPEAEQPDE